LKLAIVVASFCVMAAPAMAQEDEMPKDIAGSVGVELRYSESQFLAAAEAMPESKYDFVPTAGNFKGARSFAEQVKHVACATFAFFNEIEGKTPPEHCEKGGPAAARTKAELLRYLQDSIDYGNRILATLTAQNVLDRVEGPYAGPNTKLGMAVVAVGHVASHYGQIVEYLRMCGIVPPGTRQYPLPVR
jgi:uncharacterized damage-inducible protein DinB